MSFEYFRTRYSRRFRLHVWFEKVSIFDNNSSSEHTGTLCKSFNLLFKTNESWTYELNIMSKNVRPKLDNFDIPFELWSLLRSNLEENEQ